MLQRGACYPLIDSSASVAFVFGVQLLWSVALQLLGCRLHWHVLLGMMFAFLLRSARIVIHALGCIEKWTGMWCQPHWAGWQERRCSALCRVVHDVDAHAASKVKILVLAAEGMETYNSSSRRHGNIQLSA